VNSETQAIDPDAGPSRTTAPPGASAAPKSSRRWLFIGAGVLALGAVAFFALSGGHGAAPPPAAAPDTPRVEGPNIRYSKAFADRSGIKLAPVVTATLVPVINAVGTMDFDPEYVAAVGARLRGLVTRVEKFEGDKVDKGTLLAVIESSELGEAQAAVSTLAAEKQAADLNLEREQELVEKRLSTAREAEVAAVEAQRYSHLLSAAQQKVAALAGMGSRSSRLGAHELRSPLDGTVVARGVSPGQTVDGEIVAFRVANTEHLWVGLDVFEKSIGLVQVGDKVNLSPLAAPAEAFEGRVARVGAVIDPETNAAYVRVEIDNKDGHLRAGQAVNARIHASARGEQQSTLVPTTAITFVDGKPTVFIASGEGAVRVANVEPGFTDGPQTEVKSGVKAGDSVVSEGVFALKSELFR
jgi:cobalt-zinc-cadmium efflux system membrane fusion protein